MWLAASVRYSLGLRASETRAGTGVAGKGCTAGGGKLGGAGGGTLMMATGGAGAGAWTTGGGIKLQALRLSSSPAPIAAQGVPRLLVCSQGVIDAAVRTPKPAAPNVLAGW
jgi:hypothetical protein